jgi:hypothetical protein
MSLLSQQQNKVHRRRTDLENRLQTMSQAQTSLYLGSRSSKASEESPSTTKGSRTGDAVESVHKLNILHVYYQPEFPFVHKASFLQQAKQALEAEDVSGTENLLAFVAITGHLYPQMGPGK